MGKKRKEQFKWVCGHECIQGKHEAPIRCMASSPRTYASIEKAVSCAVKSGHVHASSLFIWSPRRGFVGRVDQLVKALGI